MTDSSDEVKKMIRFASDLIMQSIDNAHQMLVRLVDRHSAEEKTSKSLSAVTEKNNEKPLNDGHVNDVA